MSFAPPPPFATDSSIQPAASRRPNFQYDLSDIEKAHSISYTSKLHKDPRSPLDPIYKLPKVEERPVTPPRFLRDTMNISDIEKTRTVDPYGAFQTRPASSMQCRDIVGASAQSRYRNDARVPGSLQSKDITHAQFKSTRVTNPLDPVYTYGKDTNLDVSSLLIRLAGGSKAVEDAGLGQTVQFGPIDGGKPRIVIRERHPDHIYNLRTSDISSKSAQEWSWAKPPRTLVRDVTNTKDVPGAQVLADQPRIHKTNRHTNPNTRNYEAWALGGERVSDLTGMVHVHRHVLDESPYASTWKPSQGVPEADAAGISLWRTGNFTAGTQPPRMPHSAKVESSKKVAFGAPAADLAIPNDPPAAAAAAPASAQVRQPTPVERKKTPPATVAAAEPTISVSSSTPSILVASSSSHAASPAASPSAASGNTSNTVLSYPPNTHKTPLAQKRHKPNSGDQTQANLGLLSNPPSNGKECVAVQPGSYVPQMLFGSHGPFGVPSKKASIAETQAASSNSVVVSRANSRANSRPLSRTSTLGTNQKLGGKMEEFTSTASTLSNAFSLAFVPTSTTALPPRLPYSSPVSRPGLSTVEYFERKPAGVLPLATTQKMAERKVATMRADEIKAVRALA